MTRHTWTALLLAALLPSNVCGFAVPPALDSVQQRKATGSGISTEPSLVLLDSKEDNVLGGGEVLAIGSAEFEYQAAIRAFLVVGVAEIFDKTWFVAFVCALKFGWQMAFFGGYGALLLHTFIAAGLGLGISHLLPVSYLHFITAGIFAMFALLFAREWYTAEADSDVLESRKEEATESQAISFESRGSQSGTTTANSFWLCFLPVFVAEWGDRTQIAMIALHSSMPVLPVCVGSALAFLVLTASAVLVARMLEGQKLSEKFVLGISALSFAIFALLAALEGLRAHHLEELA